MEKQVYVVSIDEEFEKARTPGAKDIKKRKPKRRFKMSEWIKLAPKAAEHFGYKQSDAEAFRKIGKSILDIQDKVVEKARVKPFVRTRKGKMERVKSFERKGGYPRGYQGPDHVEMLDDFHYHMELDGKIPTRKNLERFISGKYKEASPEAKKLAVKGLLGEQKTITSQTISAIEGLKEDFQDRIESEKVEATPDKEVIEMLENDIKDIKKFKVCVKKGEWKEAERLFREMDTTVRDQLVDNMARDMVEHIGRYLGFEMSGRK